MEKYKIKITVILSGSVFVVSIILFVINFMRQDISHDISDWAAFSDYINGILSSILAFLNLYLFYILTTSATKFTEDNTKKQLCFNTCNDYQKRINELIFEFLYNIELYQDNDNNEKYKNIAKRRLIWLKYYINSFYNEIASFLPAHNDFKSLKEDLEDSIDKLINSDINNSVAMDEFLVKKSEFINKVLSNIIEKKIKKYEY